MISTIDIKRQQFSVFRTGNHKSKEVIMIIGSCRSVPYINYLDIYNKSIGNKYLIYFIDPFNYHWNENEELVNMEEVITGLEKDENLLNIFRSTKIFIHEYYANFGMFNCDKKAEKNIYQFGMSPEIDITVPNFHDVFILFNDFYNLDSTFKEKATQEIKESGMLSKDLLETVYDKGAKNIQKFMDNCLKTDFPEMADHFKENWLATRLFTSFNHISSNYSLFIFRLMLDKFLHFNLSDAVISEIERLDLYGNTRTPLCQYDMIRQYRWDEEIVDFKTYNKL